jgi:polysaccharide export outer membrane protein
MIHRVERTQKTIAPFDYLFIKVLSIDEKTARIFNYGDEMRSSNSDIFSYMVNEKGCINFPFAGEVHVGGLTTPQAADSIRKALNDYIANTAVIVRLVECKISVLGEVNRQGEYSFSSDKLTIYEALALGGGLTRYADRNKVVLVRKVGSKIINQRLDLTSSDITNSPYYYIMPGDVLVVEPSRNISWSYQNVTYTTLLTTITTFLAIYSVFYINR